MQEKVFKEMWQGGVGDALQRLTGAFMNGNLIIGARQNGRVSAILKHETCALPGMLALAMTQGAIDIARVW